MPTTIITGRDISFTIAGASYDAQATSATLTVDSTINTYQTLDGKAYFTTDTQGTFAVSMLADWGAASSLCEALWTAATSAPKHWFISDFWRRFRCIISNLMSNQFCHQRAALHLMRKPWIYHSHVCQHQLPHLVNQ